MKHAVVIGTIMMTMALSACEKESHPTTGASTEQHLNKAATQAQNDFKKTIDSVTTKTKQATDHAASTLDNTIDHAEDHIKKTTDDHKQ
ncbi:hypothetical protein [Acinetobacter sp. ANC 3791]|uniref:hypothetical protein n=1 Tax=Acinetobacter sp. ANC 3791 TaxID=2529836 RepID=UPI00103BBBE7|nr:hypothetical protein [Acinetobacter sp. ANC 3791]TCB83172.1 hypothetical protein E0H90_12730 [Acinetobacter sp. ANC 3791]